MKHHVQVETSLLNLQSWPSGLTSKSSTSVDVWQRKDDTNDPKHTAACKRYVSPCAPVLIVLHFCLLSCVVDCNDMRHRIRAEGQHLNSQ